MMKKIGFALLSLFVISGCLAGKETPQPTPEPTPESTHEQGEKAVESAEPELVYEHIEAVLESELPQSLEVTIQDMTVTLAKDLDYSCEEELKPGDELILYYKGTLEDRPAIVKVIKK